MNIVLIGSSGQLGSWIIPPLEAYGHVQLSTGLSLDEPENFKVYCEEQYADAVINAAGWNNRRCSLKQIGIAEEANRINGVLPGAIADACKDLAIPFYHLSTEYVYDSPNGTGPFDEDVIPLPGNLYGRSKLIGDNAVMAAGGHVVRLSVLPDNYPYKVAATNYISSKLRATEGCRRLIEYVTNGLPHHDGQRMPLLHICGERRTIAEFVKDELKRTDVKFAPFADDLYRPTDSSLCSKYPQDEL